MGDTRNIQTNHEREQEAKLAAERQKAQGERTELGGSKDLPANLGSDTLARPEQGANKAQLDARSNEIRQNTVDARGVPEIRGNQTFTDAQGNKLNGTLEVNPGGRTIFNQPQADGSWKRSEVITDNHGAQYLRPLDANGNSDRSAPTVKLQSDNAGGTVQAPRQDVAAAPTRRDDVMPVPPKDNHQQLVPPTIDRSIRAAGEPPPAFVPPAETGVVKGNTGGVGETPVVAQGVVKTEQEVRPVLPQGNDNTTVVHGQPAVQPALMTPEYRAQVRAQQLQAAGITPETVPANTQFNRTLAPAPDLSGVQGNRPYLEGKAVANVDLNRPVAPLVDRQVNPVERPAQTDRGVTLTAPGLERGTSRTADGRPLVANEQVTGRVAELSKNVDPRVGRPDAALQNMDPQLRAVMERLGRNPEASRQLAELIGKFQEGKFTPGNLKEVMLLGMMQKTNGEQLTGLRSFLLDRNNASLRLDTLDPRSQQSMAKMVEALIGKDRGTGRLVDFLNSERAMRFDKVPTAEQSRIMVSELFRGMRDAQLVAGREGGVKDISLMLGRNPGERAERLPADFRPNSNELSTVMQLLLARQQSKDFLAPTANMLSEKSAAMVKLDGREVLPQTKENLANLQGKELSGQVRDDLRSLIRTNESVKDAVSKGEITKVLGPKDQAQADKGPDVLTPAQRIMDAEAGKGKNADLTSTISVDNSAAKKLDNEETTRKSKEQQEKEKEEETRLLQEQMLARQLKEKQERDERERREKLEEEKKKQEEQKKEDAEYTYVVRKGDTLKSIASKLLKNSGHAEIIYDRNINSIMLHNHKGQRYAKLFPDQKLIIPNTKYIESFKSAFKSHSGINFDKIPFGSAEEELEAMLGKGWDGQAGVAALGGGRRIFKDSDNDKPVTRRSFTGSAASSDEERRANVQAALGSNKGDSSVEPKKYAVKLGEGLRSIAQKLYNKPGYWRLIAHKNGLSTDLDAKGNPIAQLKRGDSILLPNPEDFEAFDRDPEAYLRGEADLMSHFAEQELQELELTDKSQEMSFSPDEDDAESPASDKTEADEAVAVAHNDHPLPKSELSKVQIEFDEAQPEWEPNPEPEKLDDIAYIVDSEILNGDVRGLSFTLQFYHRGEWLTVAEYQIFPHETFLVKYKRNGERVRTHSSLPVKASKQMARNDFRNNWQDILREFWRN